ncbi:ParB/RepB/Spo0J family partition protein [Streptomyces scopuliridis]|uniref:ParB/RepB/Spo0J family partition protein n=1 Tax=Streptomyces scopuliridis TaxID=452529 RepID=UPI0036C24E02
MSKASALGTGSSFQQTRTISPRRAAIDAATKAPTEGAPPPVELPVTAISLNPDNPRTSLGDLTSLVGSMRDHGQKAAISIMGRFAYLEANPGKEEELEPDTRFVVIDGNSRLAAAREAGLETIKVMLDDELGKNPDEILESALVANIHRQDLDHLDEAKALEKLLKVHGSQEALAARLHRSQGWVSQRLALLGLTPELKQLLESGREPAELLRRVGNKKPEEQEGHLRRLKEKKAAEAAARKPRGGTRAATKPQKATGVRSEAQRSSGEDDGIGALHGEGGEQPSAQTGTGTAGPGTGPGAGAGAGLLPTLDPEQLAVLINRQMDRHSRKRLIALLLQYNDAEFTESEPTEPIEPTESS